MIHDEVTIELDSRRKVIRLLDAVFSDNSSRTREDDSDDPISAPVPKRVARFDVQDELGRGGFGIVYRAHDVVLDRDVALKAIPKKRRSHLTDDERLQEARAAAKMSHPYLVPLYEVAEDEDHIYLVSELCDGPTLAEFLNQHPGGLRPEWAVEITRKLALAIDHAHRRGFVHRDIKPSNVLLVPDPMPVDALAYTPKLTDFGLVRHVLADTPPQERTQLAGTLAYIAPEQLTFESLMGESSPGLKEGDIYSTGVVLYQMLTGRVPFEYALPVQLLEAIHESDPTPLGDHGCIVDRDLAAICMTCLRRDPAERYASAKLLADDLERYAEGLPVMARRPPPAERAWRSIRQNPIGAALVLALTVMSLVAAGTFAWSNRQLRRQSQTLATSLRLTSQNETLARAAEARMNVALQDAKRERQRAETSERSAIGIAYRSDMQQAFAALAAGDTANAMAIADQVRLYMGDELDTSRLDWRLLTAFSRRGHQTLPIQVSDQPDPVLNVRVIVSRNWVVSATRGGWLRIHDCQTKRLVAEMRLTHQGLFGLASQVQTHALAVSPDGNWIAMGKNVMADLVTWDGIGSVELISLNDPAGAGLSATKSITGFQATIDSLAFSPDSRLLAVGTRYEPIDIIDLQSPNQRTRVPSDRRNEILFFAGDHRLVHNPSCHEIVSIDTDSGDSQMLTSKSSQNPINGFVATNDRRQVFFFELYASSLYMVHPESRFDKQFQVTCPQGEICVVALADDEKTILFGTVGGGIGAWRIDDLNDAASSVAWDDGLETVKIDVDPAWYSIRHQGAVRSIAVDASGQVFSGGDDGSVHVEDTRSLDPANVVKAVEASPVESDSSADKINPSIMATHDLVRGGVVRMRLDGSVIRHDFSPGEPLITEEIPSNGRLGSLLKLSDDSNWLIAGYEKGFLIVKSRHDGLASSPIFEFSLAENVEQRDLAITSVAFNASMDRLVVLQGDYLIHEFSLRSTAGSYGVQRENTLRLRRSAAAAFFVADQELLLIDDYVSHFRLGNLAETEVGLGLNFVRESCRDDRRNRFLFGNEDGKIYAIDHDGRQTAVSRQWRSSMGAGGRNFGISSMILSPDGNTVLTGSSTGELGVWSAGDLQLLGTLCPSMRQQPINGLSVSADNRSVVFHYAIRPNPHNNLRSRYHAIELDQDSTETTPSK